jgi:predicted enzyme related to lactoylglutathione lyase
MTVLRIVADLPAPDPQAVAAFWAEVFGLNLLMDGGFIVTLGSGGAAPVQMSLACEGGGGTPVPAATVEVDDLDATLARARARGAEIAYGPAIEPWGVRRFFLRDPAGNLVNVMTHS